MNKVFSLIVSLALLPLLCFGQTGEDGIVVGTFNVRFLDDNRPEYDYRFGGQPWPVRRPAVKAFFEQKCPDILGLQEVRRAQAADLEEDFGQNGSSIAPDGSAAAGWSVPRTNQ
ncbi:MAG: hypothetical protein J6W82_11800 [Bacteroidales bacterium]|nr:hypothetical protein [Bacteroidales bacterium]